MAGVAVDRGGWPGWTHGAATGSLRPGGGVRGVAAEAAEAVVADAGPTLPAAAAGLSAAKRG